MFQLDVTSKWSDDFRSDYRMMNDEFRYGYRGLMWSNYRGLMWSDVLGLMWSDALIFNRDVTYVMNVMSKWSDDFNVMNVMNVMMRRDENMYRYRGLMYVTLRRFDYRGLMWSNDFRSDDFNVMNVMSKWSDDLRSDMKVRRDEYRGLMWSDVQVRHVMSTGSDDFRSDYMDLMCLRDVMKVMMRRDKYRLNVTNVTMTLDD
ncbi:hypothetical protein DPMN_182293 [Dreissena polymorpha]|uniref:Uncharacterized protein n=1 Tax=Dreissena polymorpha TaxID=45954 RepID=A0A9D4DHT8_DREPO|nr:hypothetical protein DPMN_182293 [Dreissena polymorpha]